MYYGGDDTVLTIGDNTPCVGVAPARVITITRPPLTFSLFRASYLYLYNTQRGVLVKQVYVGVTPSCLQPLHSDYVLAAQGTNAVWCLDAGMFR